MLSFHQCKKCTDLSEREYEVIRSIAEGIGHYAELAQCDFFIDCFLSDKEGVVVAHGRPKQSLYKKDITGEKVLIKNEPMVFYTKNTGLGMSDAYGISQENVMVQQRTSPIRSCDSKNRIIGVLIQESDVTDKARLNDKLSKMRYMTEQLSSRELVSAGIADINTDISHIDDTSDEKKRENILIQETHHRIKNNLQTISSILNIQRRRTSSEETKAILTDNIARINSLASMHEVMMKAPSENVDFSEVITSQVELFRKIHEGNGNDISIDLSFEGASFRLPFEKAQAASMIVNELMVNAMKHGFRERQAGTISVRILCGEAFSTIIVKNDGEEYIEDRRTDSGLGLDIVRGLTEDKLKGSFTIEQTRPGTTVSVNFPI